MRYKKYKKEDASWVGFLTSIFIIYCGYVATLFFSSDKDKFWLHMTYIAVVVTIISLVTLSARYTKRIRLEKNLKYLNTHELDTQIINFISRFCLGQEKSLESWKYRGYEVSLDRINDLQKFLAQSGLTLKIQDVKNILGEYINKRELDLTFKSIQANSFEFNKLSGEQFEKLLYRMYEKMGYTVQHVGKHGDQGGDLILTQGTQRILIQAKRYTNNVPNSAIQEAVAAQKYYDCNQSTVVTSSDFTREAYNLGQVNNVTLVSRQELQKLLATHLNESWY